MKNEPENGKYRLNRFPNGLKRPVIFLSSYNDIPYDDRLDELKYYPDESIDNSKYCDDASKNSYFEDLR